MLPDSFVDRLHALNRPEKIHCCRACGGECFAYDREFSLKILGVQSSDGNAHCSGNSDGWRAADGHISNRVRDLRVGAARDEDFLVRETRLIDHDDPVAGPLDRFNYGLKCGGLGSHFKDANFVKTSANTATELNAACMTVDGISEPVLNLAYPNPVPTIVIAMPYC